MPLLYEGDTNCGSSGAKQSMIVVKKCSGRQRTGHIVADSNGTETAPCAVRCTALRLFIWQDLCRRSKKSLGNPSGLGRHYVTCQRY